MRVDVRQATERASADELRFNDTHVVLIAREVADRLRVWSDPVQIRVEPGPCGMLELVCRNIEQAAP